MCGILWVIHKNGSNEKDITIFQESLKKIVSRGPDYTWTYQDQNILLWHTRLSIIDTSDAKKPAFSKE